MLFFVPCHMHMHPPYSSLIFFSIARYPDRHLRFTKNVVLSAHFPTAPKSRLSTRAIYHEYPKVIDHLLSLYGTASFVRNLLGLLRGLEALLLSRRTRGTKHLSLALNPQMPTAGGIKHQKCVLNIRRGLTPKRDFPFLIEVLLFSSRDLAIDISN